MVKEGEMPGAKEASANHISVMKLSDTSSAVPLNLPILNTCLAFTKHLMASKDKTYIQDAVISRFSWEALKDATEVLYNTTYRGPNLTPNVRDRSIHAFNRIYTKFVELDALQQLPVIACPSEDLGLLLSFNNDPIVIDSRFKKLENEMAELKRTFHQYTEAIAVKNPFPSIEQASSIPASTRRRLVSESSKRRRTENGIEYSQSESESEVASNEEEFKLPKKQEKKLGRKLYSDRLKTAPPPNGKTPPNKKQNRPTAMWGKGNSLNTNHLSGSPPDIFMFCCKVNVEEEDVRNHFKAQDIELLKVCKMTKHAEARSHSFKLTVSKSEDYDKILTGNHTPQYVGVRRFIPARRVNNKENSDSRIANNGMRDFLNNSPQTSSQQDTATNSQTDTAAITDQPQTKDGD